MLKWRDHFRSPALPFDDSTEFSAPPAFGPFRVLHQIGSGALGPVFRTFEAEQEKLVAVKAFRLDIVPEMAAQLADGLRDLVDVWPDHPALVPLVGAGLEGATAFLASEYVAADTLDLSLRRTPRSRLEAVLPVLHQLAEAIEAAWAAGQGHGALHPRDIFTPPAWGSKGSAAGTIRVTGFGVVPLLESLKIPVPGRRPYSAPERVDGRTWDIRADVYSLGVIAHELLTGRRPGESEGPRADMLPGVPADRRVAVRRVLAAVVDDDPAKRFPTPAAFVEALASGDIPEVVRDGDESESLPGETDSDKSATVVLSPQAAKKLASAAMSPPPPATPGPPASVPPVEPAAARPVARPAEPPPERPVAPPPVERPAARPVVRPAVPPLERPLERPIERPRPVPQVAGAAPTAPTADPAARLPLTVPPPPAAASPSYGLIATVGILTLVAGLSLGYWWRGRSAATANGPSAGQGVAGDTPIGTEVVTQPPAPIEEPPVVAGPVPAQFPAPAPETAPPAPAPEPQLGRVLVRSVPDGADVAIDGRSRGTTPAVIRDLPFGAYEIVVTRPGYAPGTVRVSLSETVPARELTVELKSAAPKAPAATTGSMLVETRPAGATVTIDGRAVGVTPLTVPDLTPGTHTVRLDLEGRKSITTTVEIRAGQESPLRVSLAVR